MYEAMNSLVTDLNRKYSPEIVRNIIMIEGIGLMNVVKTSLKSLVFKMELDKRYTKEGLHQ